MRDRGEDDDRLDGLIRYGKVDSVDLAAGTLVASTGDIVTHDIRWMEGRAGATRSWSAPSVGEQLLIFCPSGDIEGAIAMRGVRSDAYPQPGNAARELVQFGDGTVIAYDPDAHAFELLAGAGTIKVIATGGIAIEGPVSIKGDVSIEGNVALNGKLEATDDVVAAGKSLKTHKHLLVKAGTDQSGEPA